MPSLMESSSSIWLDCAIPTLVLAAIAAILGVREAGAVALRDTLAAYLAPKRMLLVLDNCEQVIEAAPDIAALLATCPHLAILATSREPLHLRWEQEYPVSPLALPDGEQAELAELAQVPAVALFVARASASNPRFRVDRGERGRGRRDLPPARWLTAGDRSGGGARSRPAASGSARSVGADDCRS